MVILFWPVLFPLSSPRSSDLPDETQEAVHLSRPAQPDSAGAEPSSSPAAPRAPNRDALCSHLQRCQPGQGENKTKTQQYGSALTRFLTLLSQLSKVQFKKSKQGREGESQRIKTKRKMKQRTFGFQKASQQRGTKFNMRFR